jgi:hypothetical protein
MLAWLAASIVLAAFTRETGSQQHP